MKFIFNINDYNVTSFFGFVSKPVMYYFVNSYWNMRDPQI
jgi:hypothetical protein